MKSVTITIGDYDLKVIDKIFEDESKFAPEDPRDELVIELIRQIKNNPKVDLGEDDTEAFKKAGESLQFLLG